MESTAGHEARVAQLGLDVIAPAALTGPIVRAKRSGGYLYLSGQGPAADANGVRLAGKVGVDVTPEEAHECARRIGLGLLGAIRQEAGTLDAIAGVVKVVGFVSCGPGFTDISTVVNGCSQLFVDVFGDEGGRHARSAVGVYQLPNDYPVEIEAILELRQDGGNGAAAGHNGGGPA